MGIRGNDIYDSVPLVYIGNGAESTSEPSQRSPRRLARLAARSAAALVAQASLSRRASVAV